MKITGYRPVIVTKEADALVKLFEELGFERKHRKEGIESGEYSAFIMKDENGNRVTIASAEKIPQDLTVISISVDNYQEAYDFFISHGFVNPRGDNVTTDTGSSVATMLFAPSGFAVSISEHIKK